MTKKIKYPIGIQTFSEIISEGYLYVDKTEYVYELADNYKYVFLSRPRRFGKSLLMSTLDAYFKGRRELFDGLKIARLCPEWDAYPVFHFDLSGGLFENPDDVKKHIESYLDFIADEFGLETKGEFAIRFRELIIGAFKKTGRRVVILIDEYDKPLLDFLHDQPLYDAIKEILRGFYSVIKSCDEYIRFAMLTGITKFGKVSVFSGINNLKDISLLPKFNGICGISEKEFHDNFKQAISEFAYQHEISETESWEMFKRMYDGYHFAAKGEDIYNPFSVINAFDDQELNSYWFESGSPSYLIKLIELNSYPLSKIEGERRSKIALSDISDVSRDFVPILFQSGYLTIKGYDEISEEYILGFPNREVNKSFWESLAGRFFRGVDGQSAFNVRDCIKDIVEGDADSFMKRLQSLFADTNSEIEMNKEIHFQNMIAIACKMMGLFVQTEVHSASGRCDMRILGPQYIYIFEFKINGTAEGAMSQIIEKGYALPFSADRRIKILIGANFLTKTRTLDNWIIQKIP